MKKPIKIALAFICFILFGVFVFFPLSIKSEHQRLLNLDFEGSVESIDWKSRNHALPLITIKGPGRDALFLNNVNLTLKEGQLSVGDSISKKTGERTCLVNAQTIECVREYRSFFDVLISSNGDK